MNSKNETQKFSIKLGDADFEIEIGKMAALATSSVLAKWGETEVLATVVVSDEPKEGVDFFPMLVDYEERWYATGKISGSRYVKRETRPSEEAILAARMIDRPLRPLFPSGYRNDLQIVVTVLSADLIHDPDTASIIAASTALMISPAPFAGPVGAVRIGKVDGKLQAHPTMGQMDEADLDLVIAATKEGILMISGKADQLPESEFVSACEMGLTAIKPILEMQNKICKELKINKEEINPKNHDLVQEMTKFVGKKLSTLVAAATDTKHDEQISEFEKEVLNNFEGNYKQIEIKTIFKDFLEKELRKSILEKKIRPDSRKLNEIRQISIDTGLLARTHGSALFSRGQTQVLSVVTLGSPSREQLIETMEEEATKRYMHHYNFPPFSTGEISPLRGASRREIGHGSLAEKALQAVIPTRELFPYTIRVASEVLASNGSTSMAATCGSSLALMDAGVPIKDQVAGISIGLVKEGAKYVLLTDIIGAEDFAGDMDFKLAGTKKGLTAFQLDVKTTQLNMEIVKGAVEESKKARMIILDKMNAVIAKPRKLLSKYAPTVSVIKINPDRIRDVIGPGGRIINDIIAKTNSNIDIEQDGSVTISSQDKEGAQKAKDLVSQLTHEVKVGEQFQGKVVKILDFGAFVEFLPGQEGLVHISQLAPQRVEKVTDIVKVGDEIPVKVIEIDQQGRINLSLKAAKSQAKK
ncbi:MAG TPA: polyribonucleotide nucleotidyltransferase [Patescibacteria group bacterium]|nr:polyribonucleotide nucleotidyltransferase [Patescibacteria group bacterium]